MPHDCEQILQWNCRGAVLNKNDLIHLHNKFKPFVSTLSETWLRPELTFRIPGYVILRQDRSDAYGGVAIAIRNNLPYSQFPLPSFSDDLSVIAAIVNKICIVSIYFSRPNVNIFAHLSQLFSILPRPFLVLGDFNCQHQSWGSTSSNNYGKRLLQIIDSHCICILNTGLPTRLTGPNEGASAPDLSLCSPDLASTLDWHPLASPYGSDHFPLVITFPSHKPTKTTHPPRFKYRLINADWELFNQRVEQKTSTYSQVDNQISAEILSKVLIEAADETFCTKTNNRSQIPSPPWWDQECTAAIKARKQAEKKYCEEMSEENFELYLESARSAKKVFKKKKYDSWQSFCASISPEVSPSEVWRNIRRFRSAYNNSPTSKLPLILADQFMDHLAPPSVPEQEFPPVSIPAYIANDDLSSLNSPFSLIELKGVLNNLKDSTPGEDGIPYSFLKNLSDRVLLLYLNIINSIMISGCIPKSWVTQSVIPILKHNKPADDPSSYRPIVLSSVLMKIAEHLVKNRLEWFLESRNLLATSQFGFRKSRSTMDSLGIFTTDIRLAFSNNESVVATFLDISSAYDNVLISVLREKMRCLNVPPMLLNFIINMLSERHINLFIDDVKLSRTVWKGLPQGSVLSPLLYNIYTYDLETSLKASANVLQYADDLLIYKSGKSIENSCQALTSSLSFLKSWLNRNGLDLSVSKSRVVLFSRKRRPPPIQVKFNNVLIPSSKDVKFLGVVLDSKLTGVSHCEYVTVRCERNLNILRCLSGVWWGAHPYSLKLIYNAIIRSLMDYGTFLLEPGNVAAFKKLDNIQAKAMRIILGAMKSSPINCMRAECAEPPLNLRRQFLSDKFLFRCVQFSNHILTPKLTCLAAIIPTSSYWKNKRSPCLVESYRRFTSLEAPTHQTTTNPLFKYSYGSLIISPDIHSSMGLVKIEQNQKLTFNFIADTKWPQWHRIFTDASKHSKDGYVGVGVLHSNYNIVQKTKLPPESSVFTGECLGLVKALEYILLMKLCKTVIFTDSLSSLNALARFPFGSHYQFPVICEVRNLLLKCLNKNYSVSFAWVPAHCGITGNERADRIANEAVESGDVNVFRNYAHDLQSLPGIYLRKSWSESWALDGSKGRHYRAIQPSLPIKPWFWRLRLGKRVTTILTRMRLGHVCTPAHLAKLNIINSSTCECGYDEADLNHIIFVCSRRDRSALLKGLISLQVPFPSSISCLLSTLDPPVYKLIADFILFNDIKI